MSVPLQRPERDPVASPRVDALEPRVDALEPRVDALEGTAETDPVASPRIDALDARLDALERLLPEPSGGDDVAALNAALELGGRIRGIPDAVYKVSAPIVVVSNTRLDLTDTTIEFVDATVRDNLLVNAACIPVASAADATTTVGSSDVVSPTLAAVAQVGQALAVVGAGATGGGTAGRVWLYGQVTAVDAAGGKITLGGNVNGVKAAAAVAGARAYLFARDRNIEVVGGTFDTLDNWQSQADRIAAGFRSHLLRFRRVDTLNVRGQTLRTALWAGGKGWAFGVNPGDCTDFLFENITSDNASTTVQGDGPLARGVIRNMRGSTQDDMVALGCVSFPDNDVEGDITAVEVDGIFPRGSWTAFKTFAGAGAGGARVLRSSVRAIKGTTQHDAVSIVDYPPAGPGPQNVLVDDVGGVQPGDGYQAITNTSALGQHELLPDDLARRWGYKVITLEAPDAASTFQPGAGFIYLFRVDCPVAIVPANLDVWVTTAGATLTANQCLLGVYDPSGVLRYKSASQAAAWAAAGPKRAALTKQAGQPATLAGGPGAYYWVAILSNGTTSPFFAAKVAQITANVGFGGVTAYGGVIGGATPLKSRAGYLSTGGHTDLPASIAAETLTDSNLKTLLWAGVL